MWYCTQPAERVHDPAVDSPVLPEADSCDHDECQPDEPVVELDVASVDDTLDPPTR